MKSMIVFGVFAAAFGLSVTQVSAADTLMDKLKASGWDGIIGTWVDEETGGKNNTTTYSWKIKDRVIEVNTKDPVNENVSLMAVNAANGQVFMVGADKQGASSLGEWKIDGNGFAVLGLAFTGADGKPGTLQIQHKLVSKDKMEITIQLAQPLRFILVRKK